MPQLWRAGSALGRSMSIECLALVLPMQRATAVPDLCISAKLLFPFSQALAEHPAFTRKELSQLTTLDHDARVPLSQALDMLRFAIEKTQDPDLGLKAARRAQPSDYGV